MYKLIESLCKARNVNITQMCREAGVPRGNLTDLKMGRQSGLSAKNLQKIADYFDVSVAFLLGEKEKPANKLTDPSPELVADVIKKLAVTITEKEKPTGNADGLDYSDMELLEAFQRADDSTREAIRLLLKLK